MSDRIVIPFGDEYIAEWDVNQVWDRKTGYETGEYRWMLDIRGWRECISLNEADQDALAAIIAARPSREEANRKGKADEEGQA